MGKRKVTKVMGAGFVAGALYAGWRAYRARVPKPTGGTTWEAAPFPFPPIPRPAAPTPTPPRAEPPAAPSEV
jgi:hypothetical protein